MEAFIFLRPTGYALWRKSWYTLILLPAKPVAWYIFESRKSLFFASKAAVQTTILRIFRLNLREASKLLLRRKSLRRQKYRVPRWRMTAAFGLIPSVLSSK